MDNQKTYDKKYKEELVSVLNNFKIFIAKNPDVKKEGQVKEFCNQIVNDKNKMTEDNFFKIDLVQEFAKCKLKYEKNIISNFIDIHLPQLRKSHKDRFKENKSLYKSNPGFLEASISEIISFIAEYEALEDCRLKLLKPRHIKLKSDKDLTNKSNKKIKYSFIFTRNQQALAIYYILVEIGYEKEYKDMTSVARLIHLLSCSPIPESIANSPIYKKVKLLYRNTDKRNVKDLQVVHDIFKNISTEDSKIINEMIEKLNNEIKSYKK